MKNLVLCFDRARPNPGLRDATNAENLLRLLDESDDQVTWYHSGAPVADDRRWNALRRRKTAADEARATIADAYEFLVDWWDPGDHIFIFGVGRGGHCAQVLTRLLGTVGLLPGLMDYVLAAYVVPRTRRTPQDWRRVTMLAARLSGRREIGVPVRFLGLWDSMKVRGLARRSMPDPMPNVVFGRHAVAIDGRFGERLVASASERIEEVWFRGAHCDVTGGPRACWPLADVALDWMLDGAIKAGIAVQPGRRYTAPAPSEFDALAGSAHTISVRKVPADVLVHASVAVYLREHPEYWRRLPAHVIWADRDWVARSERLVHEPAPAVVEPAMLAAAAS